jgi:hypothetical protein
MTLWVTRDGQNVTIHGNVNLKADVRDSRVQDWSVTEHAVHVKGFWGQLGREIDAAEAEARPAGGFAGPSGDGGGAAVLVVPGT